MLQFADPFGNNYVSLRKESRFFWRSFFQLRATCQQYLVFLFLCALFKTSNRPQPITYFSRLSLSGFFCILLLVLHEFVIFFILVYMLIYIFLILFNYSFTLFSKSHFWTVLALLWWLVKNHYLYNLHILFQSPIHYQSLILNQSQLLQVIELRRQGQQYGQLCYNNLGTVPVVFVLIFPWNFLFHLCIASLSLQ